MLGGLPASQSGQQTHQAMLDQKLTGVESCLVKDNSSQIEFEASTSVNQRSLCTESGSQKRYKAMIKPKLQEVVQKEQRPTQSKIMDEWATNVQPESPLKLSSWSIGDGAIIDEPYTYLLSHPGKDIRTQVLIAFNAWLKVDPAIFTVISRSISMLHNASLLIDDIQDGSKLRRGYPSAHEVFGTARTINAANHVYFQAQRAVMQLEQHPNLHAIFNEELINLHQGQGMDLFWRDTFTVPSESDYLLMIANKTGGLFRLGVRMLQAISTVDIDLIPLADTLGLAFQIHDDYANLKSDEMAAAKGFGEDITEGKFSFPIIHAIKSCAPDDKEILYLLKSRTEFPEVKRRAVHYMTHVTRSLQYTERTIKVLLAKANAQLQALEPPNPAFEAILAMLLPA